MILVFKGTETPVHIGDKVDDYTGEHFIIRSWNEPEGNGHVGRVLARRVGSMRIDRYYPSAFKLEWRKEKGEG